MGRVAIAEAQAHLAELVQRASRGETILITESGHTVAKLIPADEAVAHHLTRDQVLANLCDIRSRASLAPGETLEDLIHEGRKP